MTTVTRMLGHHMYDLAAESAVDSIPTLCTIIEYALVASKKNDMTITIFNPMSSFFHCSTPYYISYITPNKNPYAIAGARPITRRSVNGRPNAASARAVQSAPNASATTDEAIARVAGAF